MPITHATPATGIDSDDGRISKNAWNQDHAGDFVSAGSGSGNIIIPGLTGSPDAKPSSPSAYDDEFDTFSGWSVLGSLDVSNVTDFKSHWHGKKTAVGATTVDGIYKTAPSMPFTVTAKIPAGSFTTGNPGLGLMLLDATPTALYTVLWIYNSGYGWWNDLWQAQWSSRTSSGSFTDANIQVQYDLNVYPYLRLVVHSSSNIDIQYSADGMFWRTRSTGHNAGFTVAKVGLAVSFVNANAGVGEMVVDWIRFS